MSESETRNTPIDEEPADIDEAAPEAPPVTGEPEAASYVGRYDAREALLRRMGTALEEMQGDLDLTSTAVRRAVEALERAGESEGALALGASEVLRMGLELGGSLVRLRDLQEQVAALRQGCEVSHGG